MSPLNSIPGKWKWKREWYNVVILKNQPSEFKETQIFEYDFFIVMKMKTEKLSSISVPWPIEYKIWNCNWNSNRTRRLFFQSSRIESKLMIWKIRQTIFHNSMSSFAYYIICLLSLTVIVLFMAWNSKTEGFLFCCR